jgi:hypothetical protein
MDAESDSAETRTSNEWVPGEHPKPSTLRSSNDLLNVVQRTVS